MVNAMAGNVMAWDRLKTGIMALAKVRVHLARE